MSLATVSKRLAGGSWNLVTFNINLCSIRKSYFWFPGLSRVTMVTSLSGSTQDFLKLLFHMFPYNEILKVFKSKIWVDIWKKHPKIPLNTKFQPNQSRRLGVTSIWNLGLCRNQLKYRLWLDNDVIVVTSQTFCYHCVEYMKLDTCAKFHGHRSNNNNVMMGALMPPPPPPITDGSKKAHVK